jgi:hypothetical protein
MPLATGVPLRATLRLPDHRQRQRACYVSTQRCRPCQTSQHCLEILNWRKRCIGERSERSESDADGDADRCTNASSEADLLPEWNRIDSCAVRAATEPPRVKFIQTGNACVDRRTAYEPLPLRHAERKAEARAFELAERGQSQQREHMRLQQQRRDIYAFNAQLNMNRRSLAVGKKVNTEKLRELCDVFSVQEQPLEEPHGTNTPSLDQE